MQNPGPRSQGLRFVNGYAVVGEAIPIQGTPAREAPSVAAPAPSAPAAVAPGTSTQPGWLVNDKKARELQPTRPAASLGVSQRQNPGWLRC